MPQFECILHVTHFSSLSLSVRFSSHCDFSHFFFHHYCVAKIKKSERRIISPKQKKKNRRRRRRLNMMMKNNNNNTMWNSRRNKQPKWVRLERMRGTWKKFHFMNVFYRICADSTDFIYIYIWALTDCFGIKISTEIERLSLAASDCGTIFVGIFSSCFYYFLLWALFVYLWISTL